MGLFLFGLRWHITKTGAQGGTSTDSPTYRRSVKLSDAYLFGAKEEVMIISKRFRLSDFEDFDNAQVAYLNGLDRHKALDRIIGTVGLILIWWLFITQIIPEATNMLQ